jgi:hypothetical protein
VLQKWNIKNFVIKLVLIWGLLLLQAVVVDPVAVAPLVVLLAVSAARLLFKLSINYLSHPLFDFWMAFYFNS